MPLDLRVCSSALKADASLLQSTQPVGSLPFCGHVWAWSAAVTHRSSVASLPDCLLQSHPGCAAQILQAPSACKPLPMWDVTQALLHPCRRLRTGQSNPLERDFVYPKGLKPTQPCKIFLDAVTGQVVAKSAPRKKRVACSPVDVRLSDSSLCGSSLQD